MNLETSVGRLSMPGMPSALELCVPQKRSPFAWVRNEPASASGRAPGIVAPPRRHQPAASSLRAEYPPERTSGLVQPRFPD